jgi:hypothetical protein
MDTREKVAAEAGTPKIAVMFILAERSTRPRRPRLPARRAMVKGP